MSWVDAIGILAILCAAGLFLAAIGLVAVYS